MPEWIVCYLYFLQQPLAILREAQSSLQRDCWRPPDPGNEKERCQDNHFNLGKLIIHWIECMCRGCACHFCLMLMLDHLSQAGICNSSREERAMFAHQPCVHLEWLWSILMCSSMLNVFFTPWVMSHSSQLAREFVWAMLDPTSTMILWNYPPPSNSHQQDFFIISREFLPKHSFVTVTGWGVDRNDSQGCIQNCSFSYSPPSSHLWPFFEIPKKLLSFHVGSVHWECLATKTCCK